MAKNASTKERVTENTAPAREANETRGAVAVLQQPRLPYHPVYKERYGIDGMTWRALVEAVYPSAKTLEGIILAVSYCQAKGYDVMKKMVHVVPIWNSQLGKEVEGIWEGVAALRATAFRTSEYAGCDETKFGPMKAMHFEGETGKGQYVKHVEADVEFPEWAQVTVYRLVQGVRCAFPGPKVHYLAAYGCQGKSDVPNDKWQEGGGSYMLEKCAEAAALRKAFPEALGGMNAAEEMEGRKFNIPSGPTIDHDDAPPPPKPTRQSVKEEREAGERLRQEQAQNESHHRDIGRETDAPIEHDEETGEIEEEKKPTPEKTKADRAEESRPSQRENTQERQPAKAQTQEPEQEEADPEPAKPALDPKKTAQMLLSKLVKVGTQAALDAIIGDYAEELDFLRTEAPESHKQVMNAINGKRAAFKANR